MAGLNNIYKIRTGEYRCIWEIQEEELFVLVLRAAPRGDVYKNR